MQPRQQYQRPNDPSLDQSDYKTIYHCYGCSSRKSAQMSAFFQLLTTLILLGIFIWALVARWSYIYQWYIIVGLLYFIAIFLSILLMLLGIWASNAALILPNLVIQPLGLVFPPMIFVGMFGVAGFIFLINILFYIWFYYDCFTFYRFAKDRAGLIDQSERIPQSESRGRGYLP